MPSMKKLPRPTTSSSVCLTCSRSVVKSMLAPFGNASTPTRSAGASWFRNRDAASLAPRPPPTPMPSRSKTIRTSRPPTARLVGREGQLAAGERRRRARRILLDELRRDDAPWRAVDGEGEVLRRQIAHRLAAVVDDGGVDRDELGCRAEGRPRRLIGGAGGCCAGRAAGAATRAAAGAEPQGASQQHQPASTDSRGSRHFFFPPAAR